MKHIKSIILTLLTALLTLPAYAKSTAVFATLEQMEAAELTHELTEIPGGTILVDSEFGSFGLAYTDDWSISYTNSFRPVDSYQIKVGDSELFYPGDCVVGNTNPTFSSYEDGVMSDGCVYMFVAKQTGWMTVFNIRFSPDKRYLVFENGTGAVPYTLGAAGPDYKINYCVPAQTSGNNPGYIDFNNINTDFYFEKDEEGNHKPKSAESVTGLSASDSCLGYLTFKVTAGNTYYVSGLGTKMPCKGFVFTDDATEPTVTFMATDELPEVNFGIRGTIPLMAGEHFESDGLVYTVIDADAKTVKTKEGYYDPEGEYEPDQHPYVPGNKCEGEVTIPGIVSDGTTDYTVVEIGAMSFVDCTGITKINIPDGVTLIGGLAFYGCTGLTTIKIPDSVTSIGYGAFCACTYLNTINIPDGVTSIEKGTFYACKSLSSINIPNGVTMIDVEAFYCCGITSINIPYGVTSIGEAAFSECGYLTSISIPESIQSIGSEAFTYIGPNAEITYLAENPIEAYDDIFSEDTYSYGILKTPNANLAYVQAIGPWNKFQHIIAKDGSNEPSLAAGEDFEYEGVWYTVLDAVAKTVKTKAGYYDPDSYSNIPGNSIEGDITIPAIVSDGTHDYTVVEIGEYGFWGCSNLISISIPSGVTSIGECAFSSCSNLTSINIPAGLTSIGDAAFRDCSSLTSITLPDGVTLIGEWAFWGCSSLTSVRIPASIISIGKNSFLGIDTNAEITYLAENPIEVSDIFTNDFYRSGILKTPNATLAAVQAVEPWNKFQHIIAKDGSIGAGLAAGDDFEYEGIWYTILDADAKTVRTKEGSTVSDEEKIPGNNHVGALAVPSTVTYEGVEYTVTEIGFCSFANNYELTSLTLPASITKVAQDGFFRCEAMTEATFADSDHGVTIGQGAFYRCYALENITLPATLESMDMDAFRLSTNISTINYGAPTPITADESCFDRLTYPNAVLNVPNASLADVRATEPWSNFKHIVAKDGSIEPGLATGDDFEYEGIWYTLLDTEAKTVKTKDGIADGSSEGVPANEVVGDLVIPATVTYKDVEYTVTEIGHTSFQYNHELTSVSLPNTITTISWDGFYGCSALKNVEIPDGLQTIGHGAFFHCGNLTSITLPENVSEIEYSAFEGCDSLATFTYKASMPISLDWDIFNDHIYRNTILQMPNATLASVQATEPWNRFAHIVASDGSVGLVSEGDDFEYEGLTYTIISAENKTCRTKDGTVVDNQYVAGNSFEGELTIPSTVSDGKDDYSVIEIGTHGFANCTTLTSVSMPTSITAIPESAFNGCSGLQTVVLPESMTSISVNAFLGCSALTAITLPETLTSLGHGAFTNCSNLEAIIIPESLTILPNQVFGGCTTLKTIDLPATLTAVEYGAFFGCDPNVVVTYRTEAPIEADENIFSSDAYENGTLKTPNATLASVQATVPWNKFLHIAARDGSVGFEDSDKDFEYEGIWYTVINPVTNTCKTKDADENDDILIGGNSGNEVEGDLKIPSEVSDGAKIYKVVEIGKSGFYNNINLTSVELPNTIVKIGNNAFSGCSNLSSIELSDCLEIIGYGAFSHCYNIKTIDIPDSVTTIEGAAFEACLRLNNITLPSSLTDIGSHYLGAGSVFKDCINISEVRYNAIHSIAAYEDGVGFPEEVYVNAILNMPYASMADIKAVAPWNKFLNIIAADGTESPAGPVAGQYFEDNGLWYTIKDVEAKTCMTKQGAWFVPGNDIAGNLIIPSKATDGVSDYSVVEIGYQSFCESNKENGLLESVTFPETLSNIGGYAFSGCTGLTSIDFPESVKTIGRNSFLGCTSLTSINLPESLTSIEHRAFYCNNSAIDDTSKLEVRYLAETPIECEVEIFNLNIYPKATLYVPNATLADVQSITPWKRFSRIKAKDGSVGFEAAGDDFEYEGVWYTVIDPDVKTCSTRGQQYDSDVGDYIAGNNCSGDLVIPAKVSYGQSEYSVVEIGNRSFWKNNLTSVVIPEGVTVIRISAFDQCESLTSVRLPETLTSIESTAFQVCLVLTDINWPSALKSIGAGAFNYCHLQSINLPEGLEELGKWAFQENPAVSVTVPTTLVTTEDAPFNSCIEIADVNYAAEVPVALTETLFPEIVYRNATLNTPNATLESVQAAVPWNKFLRITASDGSVAPAGAGEDFEYQGLWYTVIDTEAKTVKTKAGIVASENGMFDPDNSVAGNTVSGDVIIPSTVSDGVYDYTVVRIGGLGFYKSEISSIVVPESVTAIENRAFSGCTQLASVTLPESLNLIDAYAFYECLSLPSISLPESLKTIGVAAFERCSSFTTVSLPEHLTSIGVNAFFNCSSLTTVTLPATMPATEYGIFGDCNNITEVTYYAETPVAMAEDLFDTDTYDIATLKTPNATLESVQTTVPWNKFLRITASDGSVVPFATEVTLNQNAAELKVGETVSLEAKVIPENVIDKTVTWKSDNTSVATVDSNGKVTALSLGEAIITATCGQVYATCKVTVVPTPVESVTLSNTSLNLSEGETTILTATVSPADATDKTVTWTSSDASVATVSANGAVTALKAGTATITATSTNGKSATCTVTVAANIVPVANISISKTELSLTEGDTATLTASVTPADATDKTVTWTSSDSSVATVSANGAVTALKAGTATITASSSNGKTASCTVMVAAKIIDATELTLSQATAELKVGETVALEAKVIPEDATDKTVTWKSDNVSVATVDSDGKVTAVSLGEATITATCGKVTATCKVTVVPTPVESVTLSNTSLNLIEGESATLTATVAPADATDKTVTWTSSDASVATVSANGTVTAVKAGSATITATSTNGKSAICSVTVVDRIIDVTDLTLSQASAELKVGETVTLEATVIPEDATDKTVTWKSDNTSVATVDSNGKVTAVSLGEATIIASCGNVTAACKVTVVPTPVESVTLSNKSLNLVEGDVATLTATLAPANATDKTVTWTSSDSSVATVSANGTVTAVNAGTTIITATSANGKSASCEVTVAKRGGDFIYEGLSYTILDADARICRTKAGSVDNGTVRAGNVCAGAVEIPSVVSDGVYEYAVVQIGYLGFAGNSITSVIIPQSVTSIGDKAFDSCNALERISYLAEKPVSANEDIFTMTVYRDAILNTPNAALADVLAVTPWKKFYNIEAADGSIRVPKAGEDVEVDGIVYTVTDESVYTLQTKSGSEDGLIGNTADGNLVIPESVSIAAREYTVTEIGDYGFSGNPELLSVTIPGTVANIGTDAFSDCERLTSLVWKGDSQLDGKVVKEIGNPNLLLYVNDEKYAPEGLDYNIIAGGVCDNLVLTPGYPFTPVMEFTAKHSEITKEFTQLTPIGGCAGWETLAIPFEPTEIVAEDGRQLVAFSAFTDIDTQCPFWLYEADAAGEWKEASAIHQGVPYLVSMPNNDTYDEQYCIHGAVKFSTDDETVITPETTAPYITTWASGREFRSLWLPLDKAEAEDAMGLNVGIDDLTDSDGELLLPGSAFHTDVLPRPLEAYVNRIDGRRYMPVRGDQSFVKMISDGTGLRIAVDLGKITLSSDCDRTVDVVTMDGILLRRAYVKAGVDYRINNLTRGIYIVAGRKITVK